MLEFVNPWLEHMWALCLLLVGGFYLLVKGADWLVDGASAVAKRIGISDLIIGLTVVAFGTSMPEFVVNMISAGAGNNELAITNILGSNAINIFVILGLTAIVWPVCSEEQSRRVDIPLAMLGAMLVALFAYLNVLNWIGGSVLFVGFLAYMVYLWKQSQQPKQQDKMENPPILLEKSVMPVALAIVAILGGLAGLTIGGEMIVKSATTIAQRMGVSDAIIGLTIVALGTSLPELATSIIAAMKKNSDLALGNCVGSCIFNIFFVLSLSAIVHPLATYDGLWLDVLMAGLGPLLVLLYVHNDKKHRVNRWQGASLLFLYAGYMVYRLLTAAC